MNHDVYATWYGASLSLCSSAYTSTCSFAERAVLRFVTGYFIVYYIRYTEPVAHISPVGSLPLAQNAWHCTSIGFMRHGALHGFDATIIAKGQVFPLIFVTVYLYKPYIIYTKLLVVHLHDMYMYNNTAT